jgi:hypothetical protein
MDSHCVECGASVALQDSLCDSCRDRAVASPPIVAPPGIRKIAGVGGWLLVLIILLFISALSGCGRVVSDFDEVNNPVPESIERRQWEIYKWSLILLVFLVACAKIHAARGLYKGRTRVVVQQAKTVLWATPAVWFLGKLVASAATFPGIVDAEYFREEVPQLLASWLGAGLWILYLSTSQRVRNTYL